LFAVLIAGIITAGIGTDGSTATTGLNIVILEGAKRIPVTTDNHGWEGTSGGGHRGTGRPPPLLF
jgi:hypothetical protein